MLTILLGILSSVAAEVVVALNKKLAGTVLKGQASFLLAFGMALPAAIVKQMVTPGFDWHVLLDWQTMAATFSQVFTVSQIYFLFIVQKLNLDVQPPAPGPAGAPLRFDAPAGPGRGISSTTGGV